ncbi:hypothetical protein [Rhizobium metallidurans]|uniref:Uncharacterized protein n=1 Tax=Rhizobium metallidurans TaxID=1265931 RepID=A0A7W6CSM3_9HYPH|nr:hypothetical protein [Rhizobium metallidurans]MBB3965731.1 hypothetical protein [Rhizobium metallidurans]
MKKLIMDCVLASIDLPSFDDGSGGLTDNAVVPTNLGVNQLIVKHGIKPWLANWLSHTHGWGKDR